MRIVSVPWNSSHIVAFIWWSVLSQLESIEEGSCKGRYTHLPSKLCSVVGKRLWTECWSFHSVPHILRNVHRQQVWTGAFFFFFWQNLVTCQSIFVPKKRKKKCQSCSLKEFCFCLNRVEQVYIWLIPLGWFDHPQEELAKT